MDQDRARSLLTAERDEVRSLLQETESAAAKLFGRRTCG